MRTGRRTQMIAGLFGMFLFSLSINSQTVDEIVKRHIEALGGKEKITTLNSIIMEGTFRWENFNLPLKATLLNNVGQRYDLTVLKAAGFIILTQKGGWEFLPFQGMKKPEPMNPNELQAYSVYMDLQGFLVDYKKKGYSIVYEGLENVEDAACYKLSVKSAANGDAMISYLDTSTYYIVKTKIPTQINGKDSFFEISYSNFQTTPEGYILPYAFTLGPGAAFVSKISVNKEIDLSVFEPNVEKQKEQ
jgi:hypothetical protein